MDGVSWSATRAQESFNRPTTAADTLSKLASFIARSETKPHAGNQRQQPSHLATYVCPECGKGFPYAADLLHHQEQKHTLPKPHRCPSCGQEFSLRSSLQLHRCPACTNHTPDPSRLQDKSPHRQPHLMDSSPYACAPCGRGFSQKQALLHHQQAGCNEPPSPSDIVDASSLPDDSPPASEGDSTRSDSSDTPGLGSRTAKMCQFCSRIFRTEAGLQRHKQTSHTEEWLMTSLGQKTKAGGTGGEVTKGENRKVCVDPINRPKSKNKLLSCRSCDMVFRSTSKLYLHRKEKHSREKNIREPRPVMSKCRRRGTYPCQVCGKIFFHHLSLRAHYKQHSASSFTLIKNTSQSVGCTTKDYSLTEDRPNKIKMNLADNKTVRAGPRTPGKVAVVTYPERCRELPEVAKAAVVVVDDEEEEEEEEEEVEREFPCPSCAEVFSLQSQLREHVELHQSAVKRRQCSVCTKEMDTCKWPGSKRHRLYHCVPCQQGFSALDSFLEHCQEHLRVRVEEDSITEGYTHPASKA